MVHSYLGADPEILKMWGALNRFQMVLKIRFQMVLKVQKLYIFGKIFLSVFSNFLHFNMQCNLFGQSHDMYIQLGRVYLRNF